MERQITYLDGPNIQRIEGHVSFIEDGKRREVVVEGTDGSATFIPADQLIEFAEPRAAVEWPQHRPMGERHTRQTVGWDDFTR